MLTNELRKFYGIKLLDEAWKKLPVKGMKGTYVLVDDENVIQKFILPKSGQYLHYREVDYCIQLSADNKVIGKKGKVQPLSYAVIDRIKPANKYFDVTDSSLLLQNSDNGISLFDIGNHVWGSVEKILIFLKRVAEKPTQFEKEEIDAFLNRPKRIPQKVVQGAIFRVKIGQNRFVYGRIIADLTKFLRVDMGIVSEWKVDFRGLNILGSGMWPQILVDFFLLVTDNPYLTNEDLKMYGTTPSLIQSEERILQGGYRLVDQCEIQTASFDIPMAIDTFYHFTPVCHIFKWGAAVVTFKANKALLGEISLCNPVSYSSIHSKKAKPYQSLEGFISTTINGDTDYSYITDRGDLREPLLKQAREIIIENLGFDINSGDYNGFAKKYGFMTKEEILAFSIA